MINLLRIAQKLDQKGQYKIADKLTKSASILLMAIQTKQDLEDGIRALYNYFDERTLTRLLKQTNILEQNGDISARPFDYNELMNELNNVETTAPTDLPTRSGNNNYNNLEDVKQNILKTIDFIDKMQISISNAHDIQREQLKKINHIMNAINIGIMFY